MAMYLDLVIVACSIISCAWYIGLVLWEGQERELDEEEASREWTGE